MRPSFQSSAIKFLAAAAVFLLLAAAFISRDATSELTYTNPVLVDNLETGDVAEENKHLHPFGIGDPSVILHDGKYYLYPTGDNRSYDVYISQDLVNWNKGPKVFKTSERGAWAPDVFYNRGDGKFYLYYTVDKHVGVAVSDRPDGTFIDQGRLVMGAIDANMYLDDDGSYYLYYASYPGFSIYVQRMETPMMKKGEPVVLISPYEDWEKKNVPLVEAPWMLKYNGTYYLIYSGGSADTAEYAIGYATSKSPAGPFIKYPGNPIVKRSGNVLGPGHASVTEGFDGKPWMVYHQQKDDRRGWNRIICIDPVEFDEEGVMHVTSTRAVPRQLPVTAVSKSVSAR